MFYEAIARRFGGSDLWGVMVISLSAFLVAFIVALYLGKRTIAWLIAQGVNDGEARKASETLNEINAGKERTPTMGGIFIIITLVLCSFLFLPLKAHAAWWVLAAMVGSAALGVVDDWAKLKRRGKRDGISGRTKLGVQSLLYAICTFGILSLAPEAARVLHIPLVGIDLPIGWGALALGVIVAVGSSNAVNLADGLDGLAGGMSVMTMLTLAIVGALLGAEAFAGAGVLRAEDAMAVSLLATLVAGATLGFLWFNAHPAQVFMGDTGSLALGAGLGMIAVALRQELLLAVIAATFVAEAASVMLQVGYFKL
ncbi:MAG: phospho-N-acetylmuramoyl-pentapeptide-transferase, partial [Planctomycetes bacterium]|nr:phospho-N-acetylmuramoyl-pentapeptide-transferase [Planctomycetota bacterium]